MISRIIKWIFLTIAVIIAAAIVILFAQPLWNHYIRYPALEKQRLEFRKLRKDTSGTSGRNTYRGVMHVHSYWSHDSEGTLYDIIPAAKNAGINFILLTDHPHGNKDTLPRGYAGFYEDILIEPGSEKEGFALWPFGPGIVDWSINRDTIAKNTARSGGLIFYAHTEEPHNWDNPYFQGMEIYNFHADVSDEPLIPVLMNLLVNRKKYANWAYRRVFDEQAAILALWDSLNLNRKIVGYSAVDTHENQNIRARYLKDGRIEWVGPDANVIDTTHVKFWNRWMLGEPDENSWIFKIMLDTYMAGFNHITNYVLADTLSAVSLKTNILKGHLFTAFRYLGDATGFLYYAADSLGSESHIMGDSISLENITALRARSPFPGQYRLIHNGDVVFVSKSDDYNFSWNDLIERGAYRIEIHIRLGGKYVPWLYTNPIYVY